MNEPRPPTEQDDPFVRIRQQIAKMQERDPTTDAEALAAKLARRAELLRKRVGEGTSFGPSLSFLAFTHGPHRLGIQAKHIVEVLRLNDFTAVPTTPSFLPGVIPWRGAILALLHLASFFKRTQGGLIDERFCLIVEGAGHRVGILVSRVEDLLACPSEHLKDAPDHASEIPREWILGVHDQTRLLLNVDSLLADERLTAWRKDDRRDV